MKFKSYEFCQIGKKIVLKKFKNILLHKANLLWQFDIVCKYELINSISDKLLSLYLLNKQNKVKK